MDCVIDDYRDDFFISIRTNEHEASYISVVLRTDIGEL